jgi:hypothetical protein
VLTFNGAMWLPWDVGQPVPQGAQWEAGTTWDGGAAIWDVIS